MKIILCLIITFFLQPVFLAAAAGTVSNDFLSSLQDAKPESMAGAFVATASGIEAALTNPAGLYPAKKMQLSLSHIIGLFDQSTESFAFSLPLSTVIMAFSGSFNYTSDFIEIDEFGDRLSPVANYDYMVSFTACKMLESWLFAGITAKRFGSFLYAYSRTGWAFDLGLLFKFNIFRLGIAGQNFRIQTPFINEPETMPFIVKIGAGIATPVNNTDSFGAEICLNLPLTDEEKNLSSGIELNLGGTIAIRAGIRLYEESPFVFYAGTGLKYGDYALNYSLSVFQTAGNIHKISLIMNL